MTKENALWLILNFGKNEERELLANGKTHEAYQIEHARIRLHFALLKSIKRVKAMLDEMTVYSVDDEGYCHYDASSFVHDEYTRTLLVALKEKF